MAALTTEEEEQYQRMVARGNLQIQEDANIEFNKVILNGIQAAGPYWDPAQPVQPNDCHTMVELEQHHSILVHLLFLFPVLGTWRQSLLMIPAGPIAPVAAIIPRTEFELSFDALELLIVTCPSALSSSFSSSRH